MGRIFLPEWLGPGDRVRVTAGPFENYEGEVVELLPEKRSVCVRIVIFGKTTPIELEYWQIELA